MWSNKPNQKQCLVDQFWLIFCSLPRKYLAVILKHTSYSSLTNLRTRIKWRLSEGLLKTSKERYYLKANFVYTWFTQVWKVLEFRGLPWKVLENKICLQKYLKNTQRPWKVLEFYHLQEDSTVILETWIRIKLWCLYLVQHMLHLIKAQQFHTNYLKLISLVMDSSISEVEF